MQFSALLNGTMISRDFEQSLRAFRNRFIVRSSNAQFSLENHAEMTVNLQELVDYTKSEATCKMLVMNDLFFQSWLSP